MFHTVAGNNIHIQLFFPYTNPKSVEQTIHRIYDQQRYFALPSYVDGLVQDCRNSIANALELLQSCTKPFVVCVV